MADLCGNFHHYGKDVKRIEARVFTQGQPDNVVSLAIETKSVCNYLYLTKEEAARLGGQLIAAAAQVKEYK